MKKDKVNGLMRQIAECKASIRNLAGKENPTAEDLEQAKAKKSEMEKYQEQFDLLVAIDDADDDQARATGAHDITEDAGAGESDVTPTFARITEAFVNVIGARVGRRKASEADKKIMIDTAPKAAMSEGSDPDGGFTVPRDVQTRITELRRSQDNLEQYVNVERVNTKEGSRPIEKNADTTEWPDVGENAEYTEAPTPQIKQVAYKIVKKGGILKTSLELLADSAENVLAYLMKWIAKKSRATRNSRILKVLDSMTKSKKKAVANMDDLKHIFNVDLDPAIAEQAMVLTNQDGYNWLDTLKDNDGKYILQPDPTDKTVALLFGKYPVKRVSNKTLKTDTTTSPGNAVYPIYCGCLKEAVTLFDREYMTVESSTVAGDSWGKDELHIKVRDRFDVQPVDDEAVIKGEVTVKVGG